MNRPAAVKLIICLGIVSLFADMTYEGAHSIIGPFLKDLGVDDSGAMVGSVSGGCIEGAVVKEALAAIADGKPRLLDFGVTDEQAWDVGLACGGKVQVFVEKVN